MARAAVAVLGVAVVALLLWRAVEASPRYDFLPSRLEAPANPIPRRIASLVSEADEMLLPLVGPERVACVTYLSTIPDASNVVDLARQVEVQVRHIAQIEPIILLEPDLVVVNDFNRPEVLFLMEQAGLRVHRLRYPRCLEDVRTNLIHLGRAVGEAPKTEGWVRELDQIAVEIGRRIQGRPRIRTLVLSGAFWAEGRNTLVHDLLTTAGGENVLTGESRVISPEEILLFDPGVVVVSEGGLQLFQNDPALSILKSRFFVVPWRSNQPPSQFVRGALRAWARRMHPDLFEDWR